MNALVIDEGSGQRFLTAGVDGVAKCWSLKNLRCE
jgi:hypothetical protein